jgi:hypothetical protein
VKALLAMPPVPGGVATPDFLKPNTCRTAAEITTTPPAHSTIKPDRIIRSLTELVPVARG